MTSSNCLPLNIGLRVLAILAAGIDGGAGGAGVGAGAGGVSWEYEVLDTESAPIADVYVEAKVADVVVQTKYTNALGIATFYLTAGTYDFYCTKIGYNFTNPDTEEVS